MNIVYRSDPPHEVWLQLIRAAYQSDMWCISETDYQLWKAAFGRNVEMIVAYDEHSFYPVGCICSATYEHESRPEPQTVLGLFFVRKERRGKGIGNELFRRIIATKGHHNLYLNSMSYMVEKYKISHNFIKSNCWRAVWYQLSPSSIDFSKMKTMNSCQTILMNNRNIDAALQYDSMFQDGIDRCSFLRLFLTQHCADSRIAIDESGIVGIGCARLLPNAELFIGPLYADSPAIARKLLVSVLCGKHSSKYNNVQLQVPSNNGEAREIVSDLTHGSFRIDDFTIGLATMHSFCTDTRRVYSTTEYDLSFV